VAVCLYCSALNEYRDDGAGLSLRPLDLTKLTDEDRGQLLEVQRTVGRLRARLSPRVVSERREERKGS
jgi:hypothetical protein